MAAMHVRNAKHVAVFPLHFSAGGISKLSYKCVLKERSLQEGLSKTQVTVCQSPKH